MARGNNKKDIFHDAKDFRKYLLICQDYMKPMEVSVLTYALMPNHLHLLVQVGDIPLSRFMQLVQQKYTQYFNFKYETSGHVFQGRYKALLVDQTNYFLNVLNYISRNPYQAGLENNIGQYPWSGHFEIVKQKPCLVDTIKLFSFFSENLTLAGKEYIELIHRDDIKYDPSEVYLDKAGSTLPSKTEHVKSAEKVLYENCDELLKSICTYLDIKTSVVTSRSKISAAVIARHVFVYLARTNNLASGKDLAIMLNLSEEHISRMYQNIVMGNCDNRIKQAMENVENYQLSSLTPGG
jgi:putative transposase